MDSVTSCVFYDVLGTLMIHNEDHRGLEMKIARAGDSPIWVQLIAVIALQELLIFENRAKCSRNTFLDVIDHTKNAGKEREDRRSLSIPS